MLADAAAGQVLLGDFEACLPDVADKHDANAFIRTAIKELEELDNLRIVGQRLSQFTLQPGSCGTRESTPTAYY